MSNETAPMGEFEVIANPRIGPRRNSIFATAKMRVMRMSRAASSMSDPQETVLTAFAKRRRAFERCLSSAAVKQVLQHSFDNGGYGLFATCPSCGYPAIARRSLYEICSICNWEDDGQDDPEFAPYPDYFLADEIAHGPNRDYSLTEARLNFADHHHVYRRSDLVGCKRMEDDSDLREALISLFNNLLPNVNDSDFIQAYPRINDALRLIHKATSDRVTRDMIALTRKRDELYRAALDELAARFRATYRASETGYEADMTVDGRRIRIAGAAGFRARAPRRPARLRFDRVALRFSETLTSSIEPYVPEGETVLIGCTAPIHRPAKTASSLADHVISCLQRNPASRDVPDVLYGNGISVNIASLESNVKAVVFVHNSNIDGYELLDAAKVLLNTISKHYNARDASACYHEEWLVLLNVSSEAIAAWRLLYPQLRDRRYRRLFAMSRDGCLAEIPSHTSAY